jgi:hypothetical protein
MALGCSSLGQHTARVRGADEGHTLTHIVARLQVHLRDDTYRLHRSVTESGENVFEDALRQLDRLRRARADAGEPLDEADAVLWYARARSLERLRRYDQATHAYFAAAEGTSVLSAPASEAAEVMRRFAAHAGPLPEPRPQHAEADSAGEATSNPLADARLALGEAARMELRAEQWRALAEEYALTGYAPLAREEAEGWDMMRVESLAREDLARAVRAQRSLIEANRSSKLYARHLIRLGDLYAEAARREYLQHRARARTLDVERYDSFLEHAFAAYEMAIDQRRPAVRRQATTKIEALLAYHDGVRAHVR